MKALNQRQQGATLVTTMLMMLAIMLMVSSAYTLSGTNLKAVGNMQVRSEALAAANIAITRVLDSDFTQNPQAEEITVDINSDGKNDYVVSLDKPLCISAKPGTSASLCGNNTN